MLIKIVFCIESITIIPHAIIMAYNLSTVINANTIEEMNL